MKSYSCPAGQKCGQDGSAAAPEIMPYSCFCLENADYTVCDDLENRSVGSFTYLEHRGKDFTDEEKRKTKGKNALGSPENPVKNMIYWTVYAVRMV